MVAIIVIIMVFSIPLTAIFTSYKLKMKRLELEGGDIGALKEMKRQLGNLLNENDLQRERIKALEQIVSKIPTVSIEDREKLKIRIEENEMSLEEIEKWKKVDNNKNKLL
jgi:hypothetical protein